MSQTSYSIDQGIAVAGLLGDIQDNYVRSYKPTASVGFGLGVRLSGTTGELCAAPSAAGQKFLGVTVFDHTVENDGTGGIQAEKVASVLRNGSIWVKVEEAVNAEDAAFVRFASGAGGTILGGFRKTADSASAEAFGSSKFLTSAAANGFALLQVTVD
jgi:hypothetical protein